jgi:excinuclease ABC subunit C
MEEKRKHLLSILSTLPESPGCYQYLDEKRKIIYVGKAKNLRKRVSSYFQHEPQNSRTEALMKRIHDIKYVVVDTEEDALLLENNLIKQYQPRYNVLLKDDKTYPSIVIKNEPFPRVYQTRKIIKDGSHYFGPYASVNTTKVMLEMIKTIYPIRSCNRLLTPENIKSGRHKVCLDYHLKRCKGPCAGLMAEGEYRKNIAEIKAILKGNSARITSVLQKEMHALVEELRFEEAQVLQDKCELINNYRAKSTVTPSLHDVDVFSYDESEHSAYINFMHIGNGAIVLAHTIEYKKNLLDETKEEILALGIIELRNRFNSNAKEIIVPFLPDVLIKKVVFSVSPRGTGNSEKKKLLDLSIQNVKQYKLDQLKQADKFNPEQRTARLLKTIQTDLNLPSLPVHIECFDNSNIQGTNPVAACVVFKKAKPSKSDYRHFHIKTVAGPNDFASMAEVVRRRYSRLKAENASLPQLIIIDGGKGQLHIATEVLRELNLLDKITVVGLAKRLEEIFFPGNPNPLILEKRSETLQVIQHLRDEAHRFGITFHRQIRSKKQVQSELDTMIGVGTKTKETVLKKYKSVKRLREASKEELVELIGKKKAELLFNKLHMKQ